MQLVNSDWERERVYTSSRNCWFSSVWSDTPVFRSDVY